MAVSSASAAAAEEVGGLVAGTAAIPESARVDAIVDVCGGDTAAPASAIAGGSAIRSLHLSLLHSSSQ